VTPKGEEVGGLREEGLGFVPQKKQTLRSEGYYPVTKSYLPEQ